MPSKHKSTECQNGVHHAELAHVSHIIIAGAFHEPIFFKLEMDGFRSEDGFNKIRHFQSGSQGIGLRTRKKLAKPLESTANNNIVSRLVLVLQF
jgi:hypothetical protein